MEQQTKETALLVMDMQQGILDRIPDAATIISNTAAAIAHARNQQIPVIYVVVGFREGMPEVSSNNKIFAASKEHLGNQDMTAFMKVHHELAPAAGEVTVVKRRISAFTGSDLEVILRSWNTRHLVLCGIATSGVVLSTLREAADKDYRLTVLADACADGDEETHQVLLGKVFPRQADVLDVAEWTALHNHTAN